MALAVVLADVSAARALGRLLRAWYVLLSRSWTSTNKALSSIFFSSCSNWEPGEGERVSDLTRGLQDICFRLDTARCKPSPAGQATQLQWEMKSNFTPELWMRTEIRWPRSFVTSKLSVLHKVYVVFLTFRHCWAYLKHHLQMIRHLPSWRASW